MGQSIAVAIGLAAYGAESLTFCGLYLEFRHFFSLLTVLGQALALYHHGETSLATPGFIDMTLLEPFGVVAEIIPWFVRHSNRIIQRSVAFWAGTRPSPSFAGQSAQRSSLATRSCSRLQGSPRCR